jgi:hypothetical protein
VGERKERANRIYIERRKKENRAGKRKSTKGKRDHNES